MKLTEPQIKLIGIAIGTIIITSIITFIYSINFYAGAIVLELILMSIYMKYEGVILC
jgi:hypothetical protein